jgi:hypothetical protein
MKEKVKVEDKEEEVGGEEECVPAPVAAGVSCP